MRLYTGLSGVESLLSTQKYPSRSNWNRAPGSASARPGSSLPATISSESAFRCSRHVFPSRLGRASRVHTGYLVSLSPNPRAAGSVVLADEAGNEAEIDVRCLVRNPLIWQRVSSGVSEARRSGALQLTVPGLQLWHSVVREVAEADQRALAVLDFTPSA